MDVPREAPATAAAQAVIEAPVERVWSVLADIDGWSRWNPDVSRTKLQGPLAPGTRFRWKAGGLPIVSTLQEVVPERRIGWTGRAISIRAVHVWTLEPRKEDVLVSTEESFDGLLARLFAGPMRWILSDSLEKGLAALKAECERKRVQ